MGGSIIKAIKSFQCGWDGKTLNDHSHKGLMKCLYKSNVDLFRANQAIQEKQKEINNLQAELGKILAKEITEKEDTGLMDVKEPPIDIVDTINDEKRLAGILLEAESVIDVGKDTK